ncbi:carboxylesterase family protein [Kriegella sp. EG-1]|nr:carboxylesterase family protein [Flavobacteriaceae bacterium EG-1]
MKRTSTLFVVFFILIFTSTLPAQSKIETGFDVAVANTNSGRVRGYIHNKILTYKGIPYGKANRFELAKKPDSWEDIRSSTTYGPVAPLLIPTTSVQDESEFVFDHDWGFPNEDCLNLNIWTPSLKDDKKRPVLFWIHGGGFTTGSSHELPSYDGENLSKKGDVVVVSINHRLNVLGFLDLSSFGEKYKYSANNSILDIRLALEWVRENISNFGGDPNNVTIFGQSGGGAKVNTIMAMPSAKGLFHKAINQSGSFRSGILEKETTQAIAAETLKSLELDSKNIDNIQKIPYKTLVDASTKALKIVAEKMKAEGKPILGFGLNWGPSVDDQALPFQTGSIEALELSKNIPLLIGTAKNEFSPFANMRFVGASDETIINYIKETYKEDTEAYITAAKKAYPNDTEVKDLIDIDLLFRPGAVDQANDKSALKEGAPVYMYLFTWQSPVFDGKYKALHCMELPFVFDNISLANQMTGGGNSAHNLADIMSKAWINFAKSGNPNTENLPNWPAYNSRNTATMHFDNTCVLKPQLDKELFALIK